MKASHYHSYDASPVQEIMAKYAHTLPLQNEYLYEVEWLSDDDEILCCQAIEEGLGIKMAQEDIERFFDREFKIAELINICDTMEKVAAITSPEQRAKQREYYMKNKARIARKAKLRRSRQQTGMQLKRKRQGSAATGYTFVQDPNQGNKGSGVRGSAASAPTSTRKDYTPRPTGSTSSTTKLKGY